MARFSKLRGKHYFITKFITRPPISFSNFRTSSSLTNVEDQQAGGHAHVTQSERPGNVKPFNEIPGPSGLPYLGTLLKYTKGPFSPTTYNEALLQHYREYGNIFKETIAGSTVVHLFHPDYIKSMYGYEGKVPHIPPLLETTQMYRKYRDMSPGLGNTNGDEWYRLRTNINQMMMRPKAVTMFLPQVNQVADEFIRHLLRSRNKNSGQVDDFSLLISKWILESSAMTCFEKKLGCFEASPGSFQYKMIQANADIFELSLKLRFSVPWYKLMSRFSRTWQKLVEAEDFFFRNGQRFVDETVAKINTLSQNGRLDEETYGFLTYLLGRKDLTYKDLSVITLSLFADGLSTTAPTMSGQLNCLASNPEKQEKLYQEICELTSDPNDPVTSEVINQASYLKACIKEGFRFFPIGTEVSRIPQKDVVIGGYEIPAGTHVELNNNMLLRLAEYFEDPETYIPERWVRGGSAQNVHPYLLLPFGFGPRTCAGRRFAEQEMHVLIIKLLQNFRLEWPHERKMGQKYNMLLTPDIPCHIKLVPRS